MGDKNIWNPNTPLQEDQPDDKDKTVANLGIVGLNLLILGVYTVILGFIKDVGPYLDALILAIHVFACVIMAVVVEKKRYGL